ncbi:MAG TPA: hypothetical protein VM370_05065 [Candidatus Thermoplasmatota archaeon]|nr:hypothetical protein [Candidatus Thermoplasmatota archaeon]
MTSNPNLISRDYRNKNMDEMAFLHIDMASQALATDMAKAQLHATLAQAFATLALTYVTSNSLESVRMELVN